MSDRSSRPERPDRRGRPDWCVVAPFGPGGTGPEYAYTAGLLERTGSELHLWCRPTDGTDPGADWKLSIQDAGTLLNEWAARHLEEPLVTGTEITRVFDGGATVAVFTVADPVPSEDLEANHLGPGVPVRTLRWTLSREPEGPTRPVADDAVADLTAWCERILSLAPETGGTDALSPWQPPVLPLTAAGLDGRHPFGPAAPLVQALTHTFGTAGPDQLAFLCDHAIAADASAGPRTVLGLAAAAARPAGRSQAVTAVLQHAHVVAAHLTGTAESPTTLWRTVLDELGEGATPESDPEFATALSRCLRHVLASTLVTGALHDVSDATFRLAGYGPWLTALAGAPLAEWGAPTAAIAWARQLVGSLDDHRLALLLQDVRAAGGDDGGPGWAIRFLTGYALTAAAAAPTLEQFLVASPSLRRTLDRRATRLGGELRVGEPQDLHLALQVLTAAAAHPHLDKPVLDALAAAFCKSLPDLRDRLAPAEG